MLEGCEMNAGGVQEWMGSCPVWSLALAEGIAPAALGLPSPSQQLSSLRFSASCSK